VARSTIARPEVQPFSPEVHHLARRPIEGTEADAVPVAATTGIELLRFAISQNANVDQLTKLMDLQERWKSAKRNVHTTPR
jgi:hypothetical protein